MDGMGCWCFIRGIMAKELYTLFSLRTTGWMMLDVLVASM